MKIEVGESLFLSWLKHVKECQLVQMNWKASRNWELRDKDVLDRLMQISSELFQDKYGYNLYKGIRSVDQLIGQAEIDLIGTNFSYDQSHIYAVDVAFHEGGLLYGSRDETVSVVIKKCLRTAMCLHGYFGPIVGTILFASPKVTPSIYSLLMGCIADINQVIMDSGLNFTVRILVNDDFREKILEPVIGVLGNVADTSELFLRSLQMYNLFAAVKPIAKSSMPIIKGKGAGLEEMKIGAIVKTALVRLLESGKVTREEVEKLQTKEYSRDTFHIQYPLLQKAALTQGISPDRYYTNTVNIFGEEFFLCSEWYETTANNNRPHLLQWLEKF